MPDISGAISLLKKPIEAVSGVATGKVKELLVRVKVERNIKLIYQKLSATQKVKTIWNVDRPLVIGGFYYPASIKTSTGVTQQIQGLNDFPSNHVVLEGTVGQGKSILLRWLLGREARSGERIPVFVELRRVPVGGFDEFVLATFSDLIGVPADRELFDAFAANGRLSLLLDGFDELDPNNVRSIANSVERLAQIYPQARIVITSRPDSGIENSAFFDVIPIARLTGATLPAFFSKILSRDKELAKRLIAATKSSSRISELIATPLLATLLTIVYRAHQKIPLDFSEFYDELFQILLVRHDRSKIAYERHRKAKLGDRQIQEVFEAFCYKTKAKGKTSLERREALEIVGQSLRTSQVECEEGSFLEDIMRVTCLLSEEGGRIEFLHQSVQEFFAARYVKSRPDAVVEKFYEQLRQKARWQTWRQELEFLGQIDRYRASKYFFIPAILATLTFVGASSGAPVPAFVRKRVSDQLAVQQETLAPDGSALPVPKFYIQPSVITAYYMMSSFGERLYTLLFRGRDDWRVVFDGKTHRQRFSYSEIADRVGLEEELNLLLVSTATYLMSEVAEHQKTVRVSDESEAFLSL